MKLRNALAILACATTLSVAHALEPQTAPNGIRWITGGIGAGERTELTSIEPQFSLKIVLAVRKHTAYAADASFVIRSNEGIAFEGESDGPWTLVDLPPGAYEIEATSRGETQVQSETIVDGRDTRVVFYFDRD